MEGGLDRGESDLPERPGESVLGGGRRGPTFILDDISVIGELVFLEPVLSDLWTDNAVDCKSDVGVGLGVPRNLGSGRALDGGLGRGIRELATFSLWALIGLVF